MMEIERIQMNKQVLSTFTDNFFLDQPEKLLHDKVFDLALMTGSVVGAVLGSVFCKYFLGSEFGLGFGMLGLMIGGGLFMIVVMILSSLFHFGMSLKASGSGTSGFESHRHHSNSC